MTEKILCSDYFARKEASKEELMQMSKDSKKVKQILLIQVRYLSTS